MMSGMMKVTVARETARRTLAKGKYLSFSPRRAHVVCPECQEEVEADNAFSEERAVEKSLRANLVQHLTEWCGA